MEITEDLLNGFRDWLLGEGVSEGTVKNYLSHLRSVVGLRLCGKGDVSKVFEGMGGVNDKTRKAFSRLLTYVERKVDGYDELVIKLRKALPKRPKSREDTYVPPDSLIKAVGEGVKELGPPYVMLYNVLVSTGCRGTEAIYLINNIGRLKAVDLGPYVRVHVDLQRGSKNEFVMYLPKEVYQQLKEFRQGLPHEDTLGKGLKEAGLSIKYFRKWWRQTLKKLGIDSEDIEAFQGRVTTIGGRHYTDWIPLLDNDYGRVLPHIKKYLVF